MQVNRQIPNKYRCFRDIYFACILPGAWAICNMEMLLKKKSLQLRFITHLCSCRHWQSRINTAGKYLQDLPLRSTLFARERKNLTRPRYVAICEVPNLGGHAHADCVLQTALCAVCCKKWCQIDSVAGPESRRCAGKEENVAPPCTC